MGLGHELLVSRGMALLGAPVVRVDRADRWWRAQGRDRGRGRVGSADRRGAGVDRRV